MAPCGSQPRLLDTHMGFRSTVKKAGRAGRVGPKRPHARSDRSAAARSGALEHVAIVLTGTLVFEGWVSVADLRRTMTLAANRAWPVACGMRDCRRLACRGAPGVSV